MSTATKNILIIVKHQGLDQANTAIKGFATTTGQATKATDALGSSWTKTQSGAVKFTSSVNQMSSAESKATKTTTQFGASADQAGKKTQGFAAKFQGNKGAIFAFMGIGTAGMEAIGMFGMYQMAADKLNSAQDRVNQLVEAGAQGTSEYKQAVNEVAEAKRGYNFIIRNVAMSFGDLIPFLLLSVNAIVKLKDTVAGSKGAIDAATQGISGLGTASKTAASGGLTPMQTAATNLGGGLTNLGTGVRNTTTATDQLYTSSGRLVGSTDNVGKSVKATSGLIGGKGTGLVAGISALDLAMNSGEKTGNRFTNVFKTIGTGIKSLPATFANVATSIGSFFMNFGTHLGKLPGLFAKAGAAVTAFSRVLLTAFLSNPITAAIAAISIAVAALVFDLGGFRTRLNEIGVSLGKMFPALKIILDPLGKIGEGLGWVGQQAAKLFGVSSGLDDVAGSAAAADKAILNMREALRSALDLDVGGNTLQMVQTLNSSINSLGTTGKQKLGELESAWTVLQTQIKKTPETTKLIEEFNTVLEKYRQGGLSGAAAGEKLGAIFTKLKDVISGKTQETLKTVQADEKQAQSTTKVQNATLGMSKEVASFVAQLSIANATEKQNTTYVEDNAKALLDWTQKMGLSIKTVGGVSDSIKAWAQEMMPLTPVLKDIGTQIEYVEGQGINWTKTLQNLGNTQKEVTTLGTQLFNSMKIAVKNVGAEAFPVIEAALQKLKGIYPEVFEVASKLWEDEKTKMMENGQFVEQLGELKKKKSKEAATEEEKYAKKLKETADETKFKAQQLGIYADIQDASLATQQTAIKYHEEENKALNEARSSLQTLALERGIETEQIKKNSDILLTYIKNHDLGKSTIIEVRAATGQLIAEKQKEQKATELETKAAEEFYRQYDLIPPVLGMTGKGLMTVAKNMDDTANSTKIAADNIGTWYSELQKSQAVEEDSVAILLDLANRLGVDIPEGAEMTVDSLKEVIEQATGMGKSVKEAANEAAKAFGDLANDAGSALEDLIKEDLIKGDIDDVIEKLEEAGTSIDTLAAKQAIIKPILDDTDIENDIISLSELLDDTWAQSTLAAKNGGDSVISAFTNGINSHLGELGPPIVSHINAVWAQIKATNPGKTGAELVQALAAELGNPGPLTAAATKAAGGIPPGFEQGITGLEGVASSKMQSIAEAIGGKVTDFMDAGQGLAEGVGEGFESGGHTFASQAQKAWYELIKPSDPARAEAYAKANEVAKGTEEGFSSGATGIMTAGQKAMYDLLAPYGKAAQDAYTASLGIANKTKEGIDTIPTNTSTALAPVPGIFSQAFVDASTQAGTQLSGILTKVQTTMSNMSTSVATYSNSMAVNFATALQNMGIPLLPLGEAIYALQNVLSNFSTSVQTYSTSMATNITTFATQSIAQLTTLSEFIVGSILVTFATLETNIVAHMTAMTTQVSAWVTTSVKVMGELIKIVTTTQKTFSTLSTSVATYMKSMTTNIKSFQTGATTSFGAAGKAALATQKSLSDLSKNTATYTKSMAANLKSFSSSAVSALNAVASAAKKAESALKSMAQAAAKAKAARSGLRFGGAFVMGGQAMNQSSFAQTGKSFINSRPRKIGGVNISEFSKPELVTVTPLSNPSDPMDKGLNYLDKLPAPKLQMPNMATSVTGGERRSSNQPIQVELHTTVTMPDGKVLAKAVQQHLLSGFSGIT
jgi:hypothetical protein